MRNEFVVKVNKIGKKSCEYIKSIKAERTLGKIIITDIDGCIREFDATIYEMKKYYNY